MKSALCAALMISSVASLTTGCSVQRWFFKQGFTGLADYSLPPGYEGTDIHPVAEGVYTFRWSWYRNIIIVTDEGLVVTDPFNPGAAEKMKAALADIAPGKPVHTLIYSHYHLDHTGGGRVLEPKNVIAHQGCPQLWAQTGATNVLPPTELISGDKTLTIGGVEIQLLYLGRSHGEETLYAVYLPQKRVLWTADMGMVKTLPPLGIPDSFMPGVISALDRLSALDFDVFVPSHFGYGTKKDFVEFVEMTKYVREISQQQLAKYGGVIPDDKSQLGAIFDALYDPLKERYGTWHGFDQQVLFSMARGVSGELLGY
jgi:glyoxylase-like metal-dependent hydrolase (beta-lactamase superfamily II)